MNCPLCDTPLEGKAACPNCGWAPEQTEAEDAAERPDSRTQRYANLPGIFDLELYDDEEEEETQAASGEAGAARKDRKNRGSAAGRKRNGPLGRLRQAWRNADPKTRWNIRFAAGMVGGTLLLFLVIACFYAPNAIAVTGKAGKSDITLTNRQFYIYYRNAYTSYLSSNTDSSGNVSVSFTTDRSLDRQYYNLETGYSWQDYFMDQALYNAGLTEVLAATARDNGYALPEEEQQSLDDQLEALDSSTEGGLDLYVRQYYGEPADGTVYREYLEDSTLAQSYYEYLYNQISFTEDEIRDYYQQNTDDYTDLTVSDSPDVCVRHILFVPDGDSQAAWDEAEAKAEAALAACEASEDPEQTFLSLVSESQDTGSNTSGGLLEDVYPGAIGGGFDDWCFDEADHQYGEMAVVMSGYGWHLVYFDHYCDSIYWQEAVEADMKENAVRQQVAQLYTDAKFRLTVFADVP